MPSGGQGGILASGGGVPVSRVKSDCRVVRWIDAASAVMRNRLRRRELS